MASENLLAGLAGGMAGFEKGLEKYRERVQLAQGKKEKRQAYIDYKDALVAAGWNDADATAEAKALAVKGKGISELRTAKVGREKTRSDIDIGEAEEGRTADLHPGEKTKQEQDITLGEQKIKEGDIAGEFLREVQEANLASTKAGTAGTEAGTAQTMLETKVKGAEFDAGQPKGTWELPTDTEKAEEWSDKADKYAILHADKHAANWDKVYGGKKSDPDELVNALSISKGINLGEVRDTTGARAIPGKRPRWDKDYDKYLKQWLNNRFGPNVNVIEDLHKNVRREQPLKPETGKPEPGAGTALRGKFGQGPIQGPTPGGGTLDQGAKPDDEVKSRFWEIQDKLGMKSGQ